jgi:predicted DNA-binding protein
MNMSKTITIRLSDQDYKLFKNYAEADNRPMANLIETAAKRHLQECEMVSEKEMAGIQADAKLVSRLKAGSKAAHKKHGRFVA